MKRIVAVFLACWSLAVPAATVNLVWDASAGATGYTLGYGTSAGSRATLLDVSSTTGIVTGLITGTTYYFAVRGRNATQQSAFGNEVAVTVLGGPPPPPPPPPPTGAPVFVLEAETAWNTVSPKTTAAFNVAAGDVLVAFAVNEGFGTALGISGGSQTWTNRQRVAVAQYTEVDVWTTVATAAKSMTVTFTGGGGWFGGNVLVFSNAVVGASAKASGTGAPTVSLTTTAANSAIVVVNGDWTALDGAPRVYRTNAGPVTQQTYFRDGARYTVYGGFHAGAGPIGTYSLGLNAPGAQKFSIVAIEVKGQ